MTTQTNDRWPPSPSTTTAGVGLGLVVVVAAAYAYYHSQRARGASVTGGGGGGGGTDAHTPADVARAARARTDTGAQTRPHALEVPADANANADVGGGAAGVTRGGHALSGPRKARNRKRRGAAGGDESDDGRADGSGKLEGDARRHKGKASGQGRETEAVRGGPLPPKTTGDDAVPGAFEVGPREADLAAAPHSLVRAGTETTSKPGDGDKSKDKTNKKKKKKKNLHQSKAQDRDRGGAEGEEETEGGDDSVGDDARSKTGKKVATTAAHGAPRAIDSTDTDAPPSVSASMSASARAARKGSMRASTRPAPPSESHMQQQGAHVPSHAARESRPLHLSFDTDGSWTHVDHRHRSSRSGDGQTAQPVDATDVMSSDLASTESAGSPVVERTIESIVNGGRDTRVDLAPRTLAEKLAPRPEKTGVEDMLEQPDHPTLSRVIRVQQPHADESAVLDPSSWDDSGDFGEDSLLVHDADQEDEGEWDIVKSRHRTGPARTITTITNTTTSTAAGATPTETMTKRQRQNARRRELAKSAKAEAEAARLQGLARHKRELERLRIMEQAHHGASGTGGGKRPPSGGMRAAVDDRGKLVWE